MESENKSEKIKIGEEKEKTTINDVLAMIMTDKVNISVEEYKRVIGEVARNYDQNNDTKGTMPSLKERRERIKSNYYGASVNFLYQILATVNDFYKNYAPLIEAIAEKVGVEFEKVETAEEKAMRMAGEYLQESARKKKAERELIEKQTLNRQARRKIKKETGEKIEFKD